MGRHRLRAGLVRAAGFFVFWLMLSGLRPADMPPGAVTAAVAAWGSLRLLPPGQRSLRPVALARLALRFLYQSIRAGIDVAWRALDPRLPLQPGFIVYRPRLPPGAAQHALCTMTSLLPGTLPCGPDGDGNLIIHCLDVAQPVADQMAVEEAAFIRVFGGTPR